MPTLCIPSFPDDLHRRVKELAKRNHRSMKAEVIALVERALASESLEARHRIAERRKAFPQPPGAVDTLTLLREDRER